MYLICIPHYRLTPKQCVINIPIRTHYLPGIKWKSREKFLLDYFTSLLILILVTELLTCSFFDANESTQYHREDGVHVRAVCIELTVGSKSSKKVQKIKDNQPLFWEEIWSRDYILILTATVRNNWIFYSFPPVQPQKWNFFLKCIMRLREKI